MSDNSHNATESWRELYRSAFAQFGRRALWNVRELEEPTPNDALVIARQLRIEGDMKARRLAEMLEHGARANL